MTEDIRYPIGKWVRDAQPDEAVRAEYMMAMSELPAALAAALEGLTEAQLDTPYRDGGWSPRQIAHHLADSHMNAFCRVKLGVTEDAPVIKPYGERDWALTADNRAPVATSLAILEGVQRRMVLLFESLEPAQFERTVQHPEHKRALSLADLLGLYSWHGRHHVAQISAQRARNGW